MSNKTEIICNVNACVYHKENHCGADTISVACDNCIKPCSPHETECSSFKARNA